MSVGQQQTITNQGLLAVIMKYTSTPTNSGSSTDSGSNSDPSGSTVDTTNSGSSTDSSGSATDSTSIEIQDPNSVNTVTPSRRVLQSTSKATLKIPASFATYLHSQTSTPSTTSSTPSTTSGTPSTSNKITGTSILFSATSQTFVPNANIPNLACASPIYSVSAADQNGNHIPVTNLPNPITLSAPICGAASSNIAYTCNYLSGTSLTTSSVTTDVSQVASQNTVGCGLSHLSDYMIIGTTITSNSTGTNSTNSTNAASSGSTMILSLLSLIAVILSFL